MVQKRVVGTGTSLRLNVSVCAETCSNPLSLNCSSTEYLGTSGMSKHANEKPRKTFIAPGCPCQATPCLDLLDLVRASFGALDPGSDSARRSTALRRLAFGSPVPGPVWNPHGRALKLLDSPSSRSQARARTANTTALFLHLVSATVPSVSSDEGNQPVAPNLPAKGISRGSGRKQIEDHSPSVQSSSTILLRTDAVTRDGPRFLITGKGAGPRCRGVLPDTVSGIGAESPSEYTMVSAAGPLAKDGTTRTA